MKKLLVIGAMLCLFSCGKQESVAVSKENLNDVLTQYGKDNPETEVEITTALGVIRLKLYSDTPTASCEFSKADQRRVL